MTAADIEKALWVMWGRTQNRVMCHNVSWGMFSHECDLIVLEKDDAFTEVEIKVSKADIKKDLQKWHKHKDRKISRLYFAIPDSLYRPDVIELIPDHAGIIVVEEETRFYHGFYQKYYTAKIKKRIKAKSPYKATVNDIRKLAYLMQFRFWKERLRANKLEQKLKDKLQLKLL